MGCKCLSGNRFRISDRKLVNKFKELLNSLDIDLSPEDKDEIEELFEKFATKRFNEKLEAALNIYGSKAFIKLITKPFEEFHFEDEFRNVMEKTAEILKTIQNKRRYTGIHDIVRDNLVHQLQVFLVGCYFLYEQRNFWLDYIKNDLSKYLEFHQENSFNADSKYGLKFKEEPITEKIEFKHIFAMWAICSLYHDMGKIFEYLNEYGKITYELFDSITQILKINTNYKQCGVFDELKKFTPIENSKKKFIELTKLQSNKDQFKILSEIIKHDYENVKHGLYSALLVLYSLEYSIEDYIKGRAPNHKMHFYISLLYQSLIAMTLHVYKETYIFGSLTQLLIIADNVQEWYRATKFFDHRFVMYTDEVTICCKLKSKDDYQYLIYNVEIKHGLDKDSIQIQKEDRYEDVSDSEEKDAIEIIFNKRTYPKKRYKDWPEDFIDLLEEVYGCIGNYAEYNKKKKEVFNLFLRKTVEGSKRFVRLEITLIHKNESTNVLFICGKCHLSKHYDGSDLTFKCDMCDDN